MLSATLDFPSRGFTPIRCRGAFISISASIEAGGPVTIFVLDHTQFENFKQGRSFHRFEEALVHSTYPYRKVVTLPGMHEWIIVVYNDSLASCRVRVSYAELSLRDLL